MSISGAEQSTKLNFIKIYNMIRRKRYILLLVIILGATNLFAQNTELKTLTDSSWIEYVVPNFMNNITDYDFYMSPHFMRYDLESTDSKVKIYILINNSPNIKRLIDISFKIKQRYLGDINDKNFVVDYKLLKKDRYFVSGRLKNGKILYKFCFVKNGYGYTYNLEYDKIYESFFNKNLNDIIKGFKILQ